MILEIQIGQFLKKISQINVWLHAIGLTGLDDAVNRGTGFRSFGRSTEQPVFPAYGEVTDGPFTDVVRHGSFSIFQIGTQLLPVEENILDGPCPAATSGSVAHPFSFPATQSKPPACFFQTADVLLSVFRIQFRQFLVFGKDFPKFLDGLAAGGLSNLFPGHVGWDSFDELPPGMHPAQSMIFAGYLFIFCIPTGLQDFLIPLQEFLG